MTFLDLATLKALKISVSVAGRTTSVLNEKIRRHESGTFGFRALKLRTGLKKTMFVNVMVADLNRSS